MKQAFELGYPALLQANEELSHSIYTYDLSGILNERPNNEEYFFDTCHVNHTANAIIAEHLFHSLMGGISQDAQKVAPRE